MARDQISQRRARRFRRAYHLARSLLKNVERTKDSRRLTSWSGLGQRVRDEVATATKLGFTVIATVEEENLVFTAVRREMGWRIVDEFDQANGGEL